MVAEAMGWSEIKDVTVPSMSRMGATAELVEGWKCPKRGIGYGDYEPPNYPADLNACAEFEKTLTNQFTTHNEQYWRNLEFVKPHPIYATARQRCIAFLKVKGVLK